MKMLEENWNTFKISLWDDWITYMEDNIIPRFIGKPKGMKQIVYEQRLLDLYKCIYTRRRRTKTVRGE